MCASATHHDYSDSPIVSSARVRQEAWTARPQQCSQINVVLVKLKECGELAMYNLIAQIIGSCCNCCLCFWRPRGCQISRLPTRLVGAPIDSMAINWTTILKKKQQTKNYIHYQKIIHWIHKQTRCKINMGPWWCASLSTSATKSRSLRRRKRAYQFSHLISIFVREIIIIHKYYKNT